MEGKTCTKCGEWKALTEYHRNSRTKDGYVFQCKACVAAKDRKRWQDRTDTERRSVAKAALAWKRQNREKVRASLRRAYWDDVDQSRRKGREKYYRNHAKNIESQRAYRHRNREALRVDGKLRGRRSRDRLADHYVAAALRVSVAALPPGLIEAKRIQLKIHRYLKENDNGN